MGNHAKSVQHEINTVNSTQPVNAYSGKTRIAENFCWSGSHPSLFLLFKTRVTRYENLKNPTRKLVTRHRILVRISTNTHYLQCVTRHTWLALRSIASRPTYRDVHASPALIAQQKPWPTYRPTRFGSLAHWLCVWRSCTTTMTRLLNCVQGRKPRYLGEKTHARV